MTENPRATRDEIREALAGNLCRCTGYTQDLRGGRADAGRGGATRGRTVADRAPSALPPSRTPRRETIDRTSTGTDAPHEASSSVVGKPHRKVDGSSKATGAGGLHRRHPAAGHAAREDRCAARTPHARIVASTPSRALALPGVHAVITGKDLPTRYGVIPWTPDENALAVDKVRFVGDAVAAVAAVDEDTAIAALELIEVEYELLPALPRPGRGAGARADAADQPGRASTGNVSKHVDLAFGDVDAALADADVVVEGDYFFDGTTHAPIEPHCARRARSTPTACSRCGRRRRSRTTCTASWPRCSSCRPARSA